MGKKRPKSKIGGGKKKTKLSKVKKDNINTYKRLKQRKAAIKEATEQEGAKVAKTNTDGAHKIKKKSKRAQKIQSLAQAAGVAPTKKRQKFQMPERDEMDDYYDVIQSGDEAEVVEPIEEEKDELHETLEDEHLDFIESMGEGGGFLTGIDENDQNENENSRTRKRKRKDKEFAVPTYEQEPRIPEGGLETKKMKRMLPIKTASGLEHRYEEKTELEVEESVLQENDSKPTLPAISTVKLFAQRRAKIARKKQEIALLASAVVENPERNIGKLRDLRELLQIDEPDIMVTVKKLAMVSLNEVFIDIIPGYRIRELSDKEKEAKVSKEVKIKRDYEEALLKQYQHYLEFLEGTINELTGAEKQKMKKKKKNQSNGNIPMTDDAKLSIAVIAVQSLCKLLLAASHFNFRGNIISVIVFLMKNKYDKIADASIDCISTLFKEDRFGDVSAEAVAFIGRMVKGRNYRVKAKVLDTLLNLRIREAMVREEASLEEKKKELLKRKERIKKMSRSQRRYNKQMEKLEKELKVTEASEDKKRKMVKQTEVIQTVFAIYFRILKQASDSSLLPSVLEGLAKFAHLINVEFFDDLVKVLHGLIASETLAPRESLHCVLTAFNILSGQGDALNIDPSRFYSLFYVNLMNIHAGSTFSDASLVLDCIEAMINKRHKHVTVQRVMAYIKRLGTISLHNLPNACIGILCAVRNILKLYPKTDILLDSESVGSGIFLPDVTEPEHCHAQNTALWELQFLKRHYHPTVRQYSQHISINAPSSGVGSLPVNLARKKPYELYREYDPAEMTFNPPVLTKSDIRKQKKAKKQVTGSGFLQEDFEAYINSFTHSSPDQAPFEEITEPRSEVFVSVPELASTEQREGMGNIKPQNRTKKKNRVDKWKVTEIRSTTD